jgi:hypothetical protein
MHASHPTTYQHQRTTTPKHTHGVAHNFGGEDERDPELCCDEVKALDEACVSKVRPTVCTESPWE